MEQTWYIAEDVRHLIVAAAQSEDGKQTDLSWQLA